VTARSATPNDADAIVRIYNQGIEDRVATFETRRRSVEDVHAWFDGVHPIVVVEDGGGVVAFAATFTYRPRECYAGIAEVSVYVARAYRRHGAGRIALETLIQAAKEAGFWKLLSRIFPENLASRGLSCSLTAVNFSASPRPGSTRLTIPSALICPSSTRNSSFTAEPKPLDARVSINKPPKLIFPTREMSSCPAQRQSTQTFAGVWTREVNLLDGIEFLNMS